MEIMNNEYGRQIPVTIIFNEINQELDEGQKTLGDLRELKEYF